MKGDWNLRKDVLNAELTVGEMVDAIGVFEILKNKYPNDEIIASAIEILRDEICQMFGGTIYDDEM